MLIRNWKDEDNFQISQIEKICFSSPWSLESLKSTSALENFCGVVACCNDEKIVGYACAISALGDGDIAIVAVSPAERRKGIASELMKKLLEILSSKGVTNVFLEVRTSNMGARALYEKLGFLPVGVRKKYYENAEDAIVMVKRMDIDQ